MHGWACLLFVPMWQPMVRSSALSLGANGKSKPNEQLYFNQMPTSCTITLHMPNFRFPPQLSSPSSYSLSQAYRYPGYLPQYQYLNPRPKVAGWSIPQASKTCCPRLTTIRISSAMKLQLPLLPLLQSPQVAPSNCNGVLGP